MDFIYDSKGKTDIGQVRSTNQDSFFCSDKKGLFIVADGMGGHAGGEIASKLCVNEVSSYVSTHIKGLSEPIKIRQELAQAVNHASIQIFEKALENPELKGMGTTATVCKVIGDNAYVAHVGDSRLYLLRCGFLYQMTFDHSLVNEQLRAGLITKEEAELHHLKNVITRSVGYQEEEDVDTAQFALEPNDFIIICSDGLHGPVSDQEISALVSEHGTRAASKLINLANERGGEDNITVIVINIKVS